MIQNGRLIPHASYGCTSGASHYYCRCCIETRRCHDASKESKQQCLRYFRIAQQRERYQRRHSGGGTASHARGRSDAAPPPCSVISDNMYHPFCCGCFLLRGNVPWVGDGNVPWEQFVCARRRREVAAMPGFALSPSWAAGAKMKIFPTNAVRAVKRESTSFLFDVGFCFRPSNACKKSVIYLFIWFSDRG